jgi:hypothetical protein
MTGILRKHEDPYSEKGNSSEADPITTVLNK